MFKRGQVCYNPGEDRVVLILGLPNERGHQDVLVLDELIDPYYEDEVYRTQRWYKNEDLMPIEEALKLPQLEGISYDWKKKVPYALLVRLKIHSKKLNLLSKICLIPR